MHRASLEKNQNDYKQLNTKLNGWQLEEAKVDGRCDFESNEWKTEIKKLKHWKIQTNREIKTKIREVKKAYFETKCLGIQQLQKNYDAFNMYKKIKEVTGQYNK